MSGLSEDRDVEPIQPAAAAAKKVFIKTFGCQMNVYDSERMGEALDRQGYSATSDAADADLIILNTCHIREKAAEKLYSELGRVRDLKLERKRFRSSQVIGEGARFNPVTPRSQILNQKLRITSEFMAELYGCGHQEALPVDFHAFTRGDVAPRHQDVVVRVQQQ